MICFAHPRRRLRVTLNRPMQRARASAARRSRRRRPRRPRGRGPRSRLSVPCAATSLPILPETWLLSSPSPPRHKSDQSHHLQPLPRRAAVAREVPFCASARFDQHAVGEASLYFASAAHAPRRRPPRATHVRVRLEPSDVRDAAEAARVVSFNVAGLCESSRPLVDCFARLLVGLATESCGCGGCAGPCLRLPRWRGASLA